MRRDRGPPMSTSCPSSVSADRARPPRATLQMIAPDDVQAGRPARRLPAGATRPRRRAGRTMPDRDVDVEDPAPRRASGRRRTAPARPTPSRLERRLDVEPAEDRRPEERPGGHPEERQRADDAERPRPGVALEQVRRRGGPDRDEDAAADALDDPRRRSARRASGRGRRAASPTMNTTSAPRNSRRAPQTSASAAGQRHRDDVGEQVAVDDPRRVGGAGSRSARGRGGSTAGRRP